LLVSGPARTPKPIDLACDGRLETEARELGDVVKLEQWTVGQFGDCQRYRVVRPRGHRHRYAERLGVGDGRPDQPRPTGRQRAGLVERNDVDIGEALHARAVLDHDARLEQTAGSNCLHHGHSEAEGARTSDDQHCNGDADRAMQVAGDRQPAKEGGEGRRMDDGRVESGGKWQSLT
jgi:hypothetical protein